MLTKLQYSILQEILENLTNLFSLSYISSMCKEIKKGRTDETEIFYPKLSTSLLIFLHILNIPYNTITYIALMQIPNIIFYYEGVFIHFKEKIKNTDAIKVTTKKHQNFQNKTRQRKNLNAIKPSCKTHTSNPDFEDKSRQYEWVWCSLGFLGLNLYKFNKLLLPPKSNNSIFLWLFPELSAQETNYTQTPTYRKVILIPLRFAIKLNITITHFICSLLHKICFYEISHIILVHPGDILLYLTLFIHTNQLISGLIANLANIPLAPLTYCIFALLIILKKNDLLNNYLSQKINSIEENIFYLWMILYAPTIQKITEIISLLSNINYNSRDIIKKAFKKIFENHPESTFVSRELLQAILPKRIYLHIKAKLLFIHQIYKHQNIMEKDIISKNNELTIFSTNETKHLTNWKTFCQEFIHLDSLLLEANPYMFQPSNIDIEYSQPSVDKLSSQEMIYPVEKKSKQRFTNPIKWNTNLIQTHKSKNTQTTLQTNNSNLADIFKQLLPKANHQKLISKIKESAKEHNAIEKDKELVLKIIEEIEKENISTKALELENFMENKVKAQLKDANIADNFLAKTLQDHWQESKNKLHALMQVKEELDEKEKITNHEKAHKTNIEDFLNNFIAENIFILSNCLGMACTLLQKLIINIDNQIKSFSLKNDIILTKQTNIEYHQEHLKTWLTAGGLPKAYNQIYCKLVKNDLNIKNNPNQFNQKGSTTDSNTNLFVSIPLLILDSPFIIINNLIITINQILTFLNIKISLPTIITPKLKTKTTNEKDHNHNTTEKKDTTNTEERPWLLCALDFDTTLIDLSYIKSNIYYMLIKISRYGKSHDDQNVHTTNATSIICGNTQLADASPSEKIRFGSYLSFLETFNLHSLTNQLPMGWHLKDTFNSTIDSKVFQNHIWMQKGANARAPIFTEFIKFLESQKFNISTSDSDKLHQKKLYDLINQQVNLEESPLLIIAITQYIQYIELEKDITWKQIAKEIQSFKNKTMDKEKQKEIRKQLAYFLLKSLHNPIGTDESSFITLFKKLFKDIPTKTEEEKVCKLGCFLNTKNIKTFKNPKNETNHEYTNYSEDELEKIVRLYQDGCKSYDETDKATEEWTQGQIKLLFNQIFLPIILAIMLQEKIVYRSINYNEYDTDINKIYTSLDQLSQTNTVQKQKIHPWMYLLYTTTHSIYKLINLFMSIIKTLTNLIIITPLIIINLPNKKPLKQQIITFYSTAYQQSLSPNIGETYLNAKKLILSLSKIPISIYECIINPKKTLLDPCMLLIKFLLIVLSITLYFSKIIVKSLKNYKEKFIKLLLNIIFNKAKNYCHSTTKTTLTYLHKITKKTSQIPTNLYKHLKNRLYIPKILKTLHTPNTQQKVNDTTSSKSLPTNSKQQNEKKQTTKFYINFINDVIEKTHPLKYKCNTPNNNINNSTHDGINLKQGKNILRKEPYITTPRPN